ncbi:MAG: helix-turn-helix domain-containing protein [Blautia sp.]|nr:helix-turn-helix domain-containing protein [Blautia sp.]
MESSFLKELNEKECFLKKFLSAYPMFYTKVLHPAMEDADKQYTHLITLMKKEWVKSYPGTVFFLEDTSYYLKEDFFLQPEENVTIRLNLRYMPVILHSHQFIELNYVVRSDNSFMVLENGEYPLADGDIILCPPGLIHNLKAHNDNSIILDCFIRVTTFDTVFFQLLGNNNYLSSMFTRALYTSEEGYIMWHCPSDENLKQIILNCYLEWRSAGKYNARMIEILVMQFFLLLMRNHETEAIFSTPHIDSSDHLFHSVYNYMASHCQNITLSSLAAQFNYSERQIIRLLKKNTEKGFSELLLDIRMNKAIQLIRSTSFTIPQISALLGYTSVKYFKKVFIETFQFTPEDFKLRIKAQNDKQ